MCFQLTGIKTFSLQILKSVNRQPSILNVLMFPATVTPIYYIIICNILININIINI